MVGGETLHSLIVQNKFMNGKLSRCENIMDRSARLKLNGMAEQVFNIPVALDYAAHKNVDKMYNHAQNAAEKCDYDEKVKFNYFYKESSESEDGKPNEDILDKTSYITNGEKSLFEKDGYLMKKFYSSVNKSFMETNSARHSVENFDEKHFSSRLTTKHRDEDYENILSTRLYNKLRPEGQGLMGMDTPSARQFKYSRTQDFCSKNKHSHHDLDIVNGHHLHSSRPDMNRSLSYSVDSRRESRSVRIRDKHSYSFSPPQDDGMMASEREEGAINLSTEVKPGDMGTQSTSTGSPNTITNGDNEQNSQGISSPQAEIKYQSPSAVGAAKRKSRPHSDTANSSLDPLIPLTNGAHQSVLMLAAQHGLTPQQIQQMLVAQQGAVAPPHLQQMMEAQQSVVMQQQQKAQEQALLQLNEQLQLNMLQQSQLLQEKKTNGKQTQQQLQQLAVQQQQLVQQIQQLQLQQRQFLLACLMQPFSQQQGVLSPVDMQQMWKDVAAAQSGLEDTIKGAQNGLVTANGVGLPGGNPLLQGSVLGLNGLAAHDAFPFAGHLIGQPGVGIKQEDGFNPLYRHGVCKWPGCDMECNDLFLFTKHLNMEHTLDDKNTAQARVQMQIVSQLEIQLTREKELLHAMMQHLHHRRDSREEREQEKERKHSEKAMTSTPVSSPVKPTSTCLPISSSKIHKPPTSLPHMTSGLPPLIIPPQPSLTSMTSQSGSLSSSQPATPTGLGPMRRRVSDKCNLPISAEIQRNREFYKNTDVRPPFTYASLIRQAIIESENKQLTLNEVYQWFQTTFAYFRRNEATWKNAVRHNLSLHKCFMRVENVKGAVWTVDEIEFYKRRPQKLTGAIPGSPAITPDSSMYTESMNTSLRVALEQSSMMMNHMSNGSLSDWGAEDLSMKSHNNSNDSFAKSESPQRDDSVFMKPESTVGYHDDVMSNCSPQDYSSHQGLDLSPRSGSQQQQHSPQGTHSQHSHKGNPSPKGPYSPQTKQFMIDPRVSEPMDVKLMRSPDSQFMGHVVGEHESVKYDMGEANMQISAHNFKMDQIEALNMKKDSEVKEKELGQEMDTSRQEVSSAENLDSPNMYEHEAKLSSDEKEIKDYSTRTVAEDSKHNSIRGSPISSSQESQVEQMLTNQDLYSPLLQHQNNMVVVSHSMS